MLRALGKSRLRVIRNTRRRNNETINRAIRVNPIYNTILTRLGGIEGRNHADVAKAFLKMLEIVKRPGQLENKIGRSEQKRNLAGRCKNLD